MGGYVCMEMLSQQPTRVASLALVHSHVFADNEEKKTARSKSMDEIRAQGREAFIKKFIPPLLGATDNSTEIADMLVSRGIAYNENAWAYGLEAIRDRSDHQEALRNSTVPVLMIMGESDKAVPSEIGQKQAGLSEKITYITYPGVGHLSMYENTAGLIGDLIRFYSSFLK
jgi:pimeloyl-ACP methyl ester carboxylesterase